MKGENFMEEQKGKNWLAAMLSCWFFGMLGMHRFYTGKKGSAWAMVVLTVLGCTMPITLVWQLVDGITLALGKFKHADGSELQERYTWVGVVYIISVILGILCVLLNFTLMAAMIGGMLGGGSGAGY